MCRPTCFSTASLYFLLALLFIFRYTLQGLGKSLFPTIAGVAELLMRTLAALVLANIWGYAGVCLSNPIAWFGALIPLTTAYVLTIRRLPDTGRPGGPRGSGSGAGGRLGSGIVMGLFMD